jgi:RAM signalling pathway protein
MLSESSLKTDVNKSNTSWVPHRSDTQGNRRDADDVEILLPTSISANSSFEVLPDTEQMHLRPSYASILHKPPQKIMVEKKGLPDLPIDKAPTKAVPDLSEFRAPLTSHDEGRTLEESFNLSSIRKDSDSTLGSTSVYPEYIRISNALPSPTMDCASYFRRSATLTLNNSLPKSLLCLLESARSILFAMGRLYQTLDHYVHQGLDERLPSIFRKSLDPANMNITFLIRSLDHFDDLSQKARPSSTVCRALVESCRNVVTTMKKAVAPLTLQIGLEPFNRRYSRWLILELYAITAEIALAWQAMVPYVDSLRPFLYGGVFASYVGNLENSVGPSLQISSDQRFVRLRPAETLHRGSGQNGTVRVRMTRRHAGSFSSKDVEIGKELPSYDILPTTMGGLATHTPTLRTPKRQATMPVFPTTSSSLPSYASNQIYTSHLRQSSRSSLIEASSSMPSVSGSHFNNRVRADKEAFQAVREALEVAPVVWDQIEEALGDISGRDTQQVLENARLVTRKLSDDVHAIPDSPENAKKAISDSAHLFLKVREVFLTSVTTKSE